MPEKDEQEFLWKQLTLVIDLYKSYFELAIKANAFYYALTGGLITFYFANRDKELMRLSLVLPLLLAILFGYVSFHGSVLMRTMRERVVTLATALGLREVPEVDVLILFLRVSSLAFLLVTAALVYLLFFE